MKGRMKGSGEMRVGKMHWEEILENRRRLNRRRSGGNASIETFLSPSLLPSHLAYFKWFPPTVRDGSNGEGRNWAVVHRKQFCTVGIIIPIE